MYERLEHSKSNLLELISLLIPCGKQATLIAAHVMGNVTPSCRDH